jgi:hypothetical protein
MAAGDIWIEVVVTISDYPEVPGGGYTGTGDSTYDSGGEE